MGLSLSIILTKPTAGVLFGLQEGSGNPYNTIHKQLSTGDDLQFHFTVMVKGDAQKDAEPKWSGPYVQGPSGSKFVYIDIGTYAGQHNTHWARRLKIPLTGISWQLLQSLKPSQQLEAIVPGVGKDGGPNCATVKPFDGWHVRA